MRCLSELPEGDGRLLHTQKRKVIAQCHTDVIQYRLLANLARVILG
jgi:hypothetical protein